MLLIIIVWLDQTKDVDGVRDSAASLEAYEVRQQAQGQWLDILARLAPELNVAIARLGRHVPCPVHGGKDGFRLFHDAPETGGGICNTCGGFGDGFALLMWLQGWRFPATLQAVADSLGVVSVPATRPFRPTIGGATDAWRASAIDCVWAEALDPYCSAARPLRRYLARRGLDHRLLHKDTVRFHLSLGYWDHGQRVGTYPAMVARVVSPTGKLVTLHRTYLTTTGAKAPVVAPRKLMPYPQNLILHGSAIRLAPVTSHLGVAEGIETALAVQRLSGEQCWAAGSAAFLATWEPPEEVQSVTIWADRDRSGAGEQAARRLARQLRDRDLQVDIAVPAQRLPPGRNSIDWADVLKAQLARPA